MGDGMKGKTIDIESEFHALLFIAKLSTYTRTKKFIFYQRNGSR